MSNLVLFVVFDFGMDLLKLLALSCNLRALLISVSIKKNCHTLAEASQMKRSGLY